MAVKFKAADKVVDKLTKDGLVSENKSTGAEEKVSSRLSEVSFDKKNGKLNIDSKSSDNGSIEDKSKKKRQYHRQIVQTEGGLSVISDSTPVSENAPRAVTHNTAFVPENKIGRTADRPVLAVKNETETSKLITPDKGVHSEKLTDNSGKLKMAREEKGTVPKAAGNSQKKASVLKFADTEADSVSVKHSDTNLSVYNSENKNAENISALRFSENKTGNTSQADNVYPDNSEKSVKTTRRRYYIRKHERLPNKNGFSAVPARERYRAACKKERLRVHTGKSLQFADNGEKLNFEKPPEAVLPITSATDPSDSGARQQVKRKIVLSYNRRINVRYTYKDGMSPAKKASIQEYKKAVDSKLEKLDKSIEKLDLKEARLEKQIPKHYVVKLKKEYDPEKGRKVTAFKFEKEIKPAGYKNPIEKAAGSAVNVSGAAVRNVKNIAHSQVSKYEQDNVGIEAAHKTLYAVEGVASSASSAVHRTLRFAEESKHTRLKTVREKKSRLQEKSNYLRYDRENPMTDNSKQIKKIMQKNRQKRKYAENYRNAKRTGENIKTASETLIKLGKKSAEVIARNSKIILVIAAVLIAFIIIGGVTSSFVMMLTEQASSLAVAGVSAEKEDIDNSEDYMNSLEDELREKINNIQTDYPDYNEYIFDLDTIGHDTEQLIAYLTAMFEDFRYSDVKDDIKSLFDDMYTLTITSTSETRYYDDGTTYEYKILYVTLEAVPMEDVTIPIMDDNEVTELYELYLEIYGEEGIYANADEEDTV